MIAFGRHSWRHLGLVLLCAGTLAAQSQPAQQDPSQQDQSQQPGQPPPADQPSPQRPTLGPPPDQPSQPNRPTLREGGPSPAGPHAPNTNDPQRLLHVHSIFIEEMDNGLSEKLMEQIGVKGVFRIVANRKDADAVLHGTCFDSTHLRTVHSEVFLQGRNGDAIWQDVVRQPYKPPPLTEAVATTAQAIADDLIASLREARRK
ncbi:MAG TPA: hypothetical protein VG860_07240 [Terriglobia bacterium]|nr:hypothetical protein [Terriglobia bacterium]